MKKPAAVVIPATKAMRSAVRTGVNPYDTHSAFAARYSLLARLNAGKSAQ